MRNALILLCIGVLQAHAIDAYSQKTMLSLNFSDTELSKVIDKIEVESEFFFLYNEKLLDTDRKVSITANDQLINVILDNLFAGTDVKYTIFDRKIILAPDYLTNDVQQTQQAKVSGTVTDASTDEPMPGVNIQVKGTTIGAISDLSGKYSISADERNETLVFSFIGYVTQEFALNGRTTLDVVLASDIAQLEEVVVVGYGTQKRVNLTGAVSTVRIDENLASRTLTNASSGLSGLVSGLSVQQSSGMAGNDEVRLLIRGLGTVNSASPLIVVDGMPDVDINRINMDDIESISVLKDAASASVYGSRAANGVILITTKMGSKDKVKLNYTGTYGVSQPVNFYNYLADYPRSLTMHMRAADNGQSSQFYKQGTIDEWFAKGMVDPILFPNTNQWDVLIRNGLISTQNFSASGGSDLMNFYVSAGVIDQTGIQISNDNKRYNMRTNADWKITPRVKVGVRMDGSWSVLNYALDEGFTGDQSVDVQYAISGILPQHPVTGQWGGAMAYGEDVYAQNSLSRYLTNHNNRERQEYNGNLFGEWTPLEGLVTRIDFGLSYFNQFTKSYKDPADEWNFQTGQIARVLVTESEALTNNISQGHKTHLQARLTYDKDLFKGHHLTILAATTQESWFGRSLRGSRNDRINPLLTELDACLTTTQTNSGSSYSEGLRSYIGRLNYRILDRYLFEANVRYDGL